MRLLGSQASGHLCVIYSCSITVNVQPVSFELICLKEMYSLEQGTANLAAALQILNTRQQLILLLGKLDLTTALWSMRCRQW